MITIGMPHYNDRDGAYFTLQALRMYHDMTDVELLIVDNGSSEWLKKWAPAWGAAKYVEDSRVTGTAYAKNKVFEHASGEFVLCIDCHVLLMPGAVDSLKAWVESNRGSKDLVYGALGYDHLKSWVPAMKDVWRGHMWGIWGKEYRTADMPTEPFEIWGHGGGCFGCFKDAWLGFHHDFKGFGGEEGYLPEKYRKAGRKVWSLPFLKWIHRFGTGTGYSLRIEDRIRNYLIGHQELGLDESRMIEHFGAEAVDRERAKLNVTPKIVCCCPTYGRYDCLNETVESFLRQDYQPKQMLICNDDPRVKYSIDSPQIEVMNLPERCPSLGDKYNLLIDHAIEKYPDHLIMIWPQDDIMLPWALTEAAKHYQAANCGCCYPKGRWFSMRNKIEKFEPKAISPLAIFNADHYRAVGGYKGISVGEDVSFMERSKKVACQCIGTELGQDRAYHIYRWANKNYHVSGFNPAVAWEKCRVEVEKSMSPGNYRITPVWNADYVSMVKNWSNPWFSTPAKT